ncbi:hypothetical protein B0T16DRAFT_429392 [Cercophora newfieldiana]|uniref:Uncharacterized protein n=1 Tax=Cercophora newfieldiana TaxID=92897 RepID=A0AA40CR88_9PEZI|nr:hypothetical protein B0T16DRAFT_429392 [Cercophora newfieldiana]
MSSSGALTRSRSTRQARAEAGRGDDEQRTVSPSRLPLKGVPASAGTATSSRAPSAASGPKSTRPLSAVLTSSTAVSRPTTSSGLPAASSASGQRATPGHARTKSSVTTLTGATTLRPPSQGSTATAPQPAPTDRSRPPITRAAAPSHHRRQLSGPTPSTTTSLTARRPTRDRDAPPQLQPQQQQQQPPPDRHRPAFTTLQQHYSPAKSLAPKPLTATFLAPPSPSKLPANVALSAETARLQTELLQLHLMHRSAATVTAQWRASARAKLGSQLAVLLAQDQAVAAAEREIQEERNVKALLEWGGADGRGLEEKVQVLDAVLSSLWAMGESGGRYARVVRGFEKWIVRVERVVQARNRVGGLDGLVESGEEVLVGEMDSVWKEEVRVLGRRLEEVRRGLKGLLDGGGEESGGSLERIVRGCEVLVEGMVEELEVMLGIEREVVREEMAWVRGVNRGVGEEIGGKRAGAIWRVF